MRSSILTYLERVQALGDNHNHVNLRRHIYAGTESKKNSESYAIGPTKA